MGNFNGQCMYCEYFVRFAEDNLCNAFHTPNKRIDEWIECIDFKEKDYLAAKDQDEEIRKRVRIELPAIAPVKEIGGTKFSRIVQKTV